MVGIAARMQRRRKGGFARLLPNYGQTTLLIAACFLFVTCFLGQQSARSQFMADSSIALVDGGANRGETAGGEANTSAKQVTVAPVGQPKPIEAPRFAETKGVVSHTLATEPKPVHVALISEPKTVDVGPKPVSVDSISKSKPVSEPKPVVHEHHVALKPETQNTTPLKAPKRLQSLQEYLHFTDNTRLNFMHFHKTGGVSYKISLYTFFGDRKKKDGTSVEVRDACYEEKFNGSKRWQCDWKPLWKMAPAERAKIDVFFGHQYRENGVDFFLKGRDVRTFAVMRHPFARKVSFFYHFFVRERKRKESEVPFSELRDFLLTEKIPEDAEAGWDIGPNYMAGRLLSTDVSDFVGDKRRRHYEVPAAKEEEVVRKSKEIIRNYVFIGLQTETDASVCMLKKTVEEFNKVHGIVNNETDAIAQGIPRDNAGSYKMTSAMVWDKLTLEEQKMFNEAERVDLAIYEEGLKMFKQQVKQFKCDHLVKKTQLS